MKKKETFFKGFILIWITGMMYSIAFCQIESQSVVSANGEFFQSANFHLTWTLGEVLIDTYKQGNIILTNGFHQSRLLFLVENDIEPINIIFFPNPCLSFLQIEWNKPVRNAKIKLFDFSGKILLTQELTQERQSSIINMDPYPKGMYLVKFIYPMNSTIEIAGKIIKY